MKQLLIFTFIFVCSSVYIAYSKPAQPEFKQCVPLVLVKAAMAPYGDGKTFNIEIVRPNIVRETCVNQWFVKGRYAQNKGVDYSIRCFVTAIDSAFIYTEARNPDNIWVMYDGDRKRPQCEGIEPI